MDNRTLHNDPDVIAAVEQAGASVWHLPPYSPTSTRSNRCGRRSRRILRSLEARTAEALLDAIGIALWAVTAEDAHGRLAHCGYRNTE